MTEQQQTISRIIDYILSGTWLDGFEPDSDELHERIRSGNRAIEILYKLRGPAERVNK